MARSLRGRVLVLQVLTPIVHSRLALSQCGQHSGRFRRITLVYARPMFTLRQIAVQTNHLEARWEAIVKQPLVELVPFTRNAEFSAHLVPVPCDVVDT